MGISRHLTEKTALWDGQGIPAPGWGQIKSTCLPAQSRATPLSRKHSHLPLTHTAASPTGPPGPPVAELTPPESADSALGPGTHQSHPSPSPLQTQAWPAHLLCLVSCLLACVFL